MGFWIGLFWLLSLGVGLAAGYTRGRPGLGLLLAFVLGPIGWCVLMCVPSARPACPNCRAKQTEKAWEKGRQYWYCPACKHSWWPSGVIGQMNR